MSHTAPYTGNLDAEDRLLLVCCAAAVQPAAEDVSLGDTRDIDWASFVARARWHGVHGTICAVVGERLRPAIPERPWDALRHVAHRQARHNLAVAEALGEIVERLDRAGVRYAVLKGLPLAERLYGTITARRCRDIDLLVEPAAFATVRRLLEELGYTSTHGLSQAQDRVWLRYAADLPMGNPDRQVLVELHQGFEMRPRGAARRCVRNLLEAARPAEVNGLQVPAPLGPELIAYLAWHGTKHAWFRLFWLLDIAALELRAGVSDREAVWAASADIGQQRSLALAWWLSSSLFGVPGRSEIVGTETTHAERLGLRVIEDTFGHPSPPRPFTLGRRQRALSWQWATARGAGQRVGVVADYLVSVQPADIRAIPLPEGLYWMYPLLRPLRVAARFIAAMGRLVLRRSPVGKGDSSGATPSPGQ